MIELKRSSVEMADGVRQLITNQEEIFNKGFFSTVQLVFAGSDSQGLRYGTAGTPEQFFVEWKDEAADGAPPTAGALLDRPLAELCEKSRLLDLIRNFIIFDAGQKKVPRPHQFCGREGRAGTHRASARAASSGTPRAAARASSWCCSPSGCWSTTPRPASSSSPTATSWTNRSRA